MWETPEDLSRLQDLIDRSFAGAQSPQLRFIVTPDLAMNAQEVVDFFRGRKVAVLATSNSHGEPYASPSTSSWSAGDFSSVRRKAPCAPAT